MANYRVHAVAVDENWYSEKAFQYADNTYDKAEPFVLIYGEYKGWPGFDPSPARRDAEEIRKVYMEKCAQSSVSKQFKFNSSQRTTTQRECAFRKLVYQTSKELADGICRTAADSGASDITIGSRGLGALGR
jgi:hypothetical protein